MSKRLQISLIVLIVLASLFLLVQLMPVLGKIYTILFELFLPFLVSIILAYILYPIVRKMQRFGVRKNYAILVVILVITYLMVFIAVNFTPIILHELSDIDLNLPKLINDLDAMLTKVGKNFRFLPKDKQLSVGNIINYVKQNGNNIKDYFFDINLSVYEYISIIIISPALTIYLLVDYDAIKKRIKDTLTKYKYYNMLEFFKELNSQLSIYFRSLMLVTFILTLVSTLCFMMIGLKYPLFFGIIIGITNLIPVIGQYIGGLFAALFALTIAPILVVKVAILIIILQLIESNFLTPYIQSRSFKCSPILIIIAFIVFGYMFGFFGMVMAIPLLSVTMLSVKYTLKFYQTKKNLFK